MYTDANTFVKINLALNNNYMREQYLFTVNQISYAYSTLNEQPNQGGSLRFVQTLIVAMLIL